ncbi:C2 domain-containing protein [Artemisia annua]|uniref:C2 domain-containing protein n=1 Tax=Artemisia annua TaxID=35608 RepID=A0A2U1PRA4_ARTAN|nr:C2 domain-containing protein [Artemisia annua]
MGKIWVEICLISARGLTRTSSLWKLLWFAVGWIDPNNKYCTNVDASGNANPKWKTKFSALVDNSDSKFDDLALNVEVYSRDPVFLKERLQGTAIVGLKEFFDKHKNNSEESRHVEEVGSFQLRKKNSNKQQGFVDVSVKISQETDEGSSYEGADPKHTVIQVFETLEGCPTLVEGDEVGIKLKIRDHGVNLPSQVGHSENHLQTNYPTMLPPGPSYHQPRAPVPLNYPLAGGNLPTSYINMPSSAGARPGPGFATGLGAGALAAGAAIFGEDFVSGFDLPTSFTISTDPPF